MLAWSKVMQMRPEAKPADSRGHETERAAGPVLELVGVSRTYETTSGRVTALDAVSVTIPYGQFVVVLGPSGSGKTTLVNILGALDHASSGTVRIAGRDVTDASKREMFEIRRRTVSFIFQSFNLFPGLTAHENVQFGIDAADREGGPSAAEVLDSVGLGERLDQFPSQLSGGEQQRVAVARALATGNPVILADEPTGELDFQTGTRILELLQAQIAADRAVILVTHNREIARAADRVLELSGGRITGDGPPPGGKLNVRDLYW
jgi:putative ABC transport system ATP-binding protein